MKKIDVVGRMEGFEVSGRVYHPDGIAPTLGTMQGGGQQPFILCQHQEGVKNEPSNSNSENGSHHR